MINTNELLLNLVLICAIIYVILHIVRFYRYNIHYRRHTTSFIHNHIYNKIMIFLNDLDIIENRKKELRDAPNKLCNQNCNHRQKLLIKIFQENTSVLNHIQTCLLVRLNEEFQKLKEKFAKDYDKIKQKFNLPDEVVKWVSALNQYA